MHYDIKKVLPEVQAAWAERDLKKLLDFWYNVIVPIPNAEFIPGHPHWENAPYVALSLDSLAAERLTPEQFQSSYARWRVIEAGYELRDRAAARQAQMPA